MTRLHCWRWTSVLALIPRCACDSAPAPTTPSSSSSSFLTGTWRGTVRIHVTDRSVDTTRPAVTRSTTWTFEVVPQTNLPSFRATIHSVNAWLPMDTIAATALTPTNTPPAQIGTQGDYSSPRGCRETFGSVGTADAAQIDADFTGADCNAVTFTGRVSLTKQ